MNSLSNQTPQNLLLATLPTEEYQSLIQQSEDVDLPLHQVIYQPGEVMKYAYFPNQGMISLVAMTKEDASVEIGLIGKEGMVGLPIILGGNSSISLAVVQVAGSAIRIEAKQLKAEFDKGGYFQSLLLRYIQARLTQVSQTSVCNRLHRMEERLARLLLIVHDCLHFLRDSQRIFSCNMILEHLWSNEDTPGEEAVGAYIKSLRHKLKEKGASSNLIETLYGIGYRLGAAVGKSRE